ncbi:MAG: hybrid sensor histidine kinase/response regulator [Gammaproteobacteria bacterium]|nr:hybrid sensor histidine kinase/response regulator [Gammaproteobacteria bacterium]
MIEDKELAQLFKVESAEHLARLDDGFLRLEKTPADQPLLEEVFRESHSLKGAARMLGLSKIETAAHGLETILNTARKGETPLTPNVIERMSAVLGDLRRLVQEALAPNAEQPNADFGFRNAELRTDTTPAPALDTLQSEIPIPQSSAPHSTDSAIPNPQSAFDSFQIETVRVETRKLDDLLTLVGELSVIEGRVQHRLSLMDDLLEQWALLERSRRERKADFGMRMAEFGKRIQPARDAFYEDSTRLETTVNTLEDRVHAARLLPLSTVFALFPRMVRDLAKAQGKEVELLIEGGEIGVDKRVLEDMKDPLMHLLRNAIDHGIEAQPEREGQGKPLSGTVRLQAMREGSGVLLEVRDDGCGLNMEAIRQVALKRGLHDEATLAAMTPAQLQQLIFLPGFSTSTFVSELSGRGVGLDVVRVNVERLKGEIRIESSPQQGTAIQMRLPLSLATTRLLLASAGDRLYGLPIEFVHSSRRVREEDMFTLEGRPAFSLDEQPVIAPRLADLLGLPAVNQGSGTVCIVVEVGAELLGLRVDELLDEEEVVSKPLGTPLTRVRNVSGMAILGNGEICAVLNPADLLRTAKKTIAEFGLRIAERTEFSTPHSAIRILLVEDSALVRAMEKRILEDAGYEVVATADGMNALDALGRHSFAAVVSDIVMPNMDGLTLTARIRKEPRYKDLPVILVTSLASDEDKRRGLEVGANAYIPKPSFDQRVLLETLKRLI